MILWMIPGFKIKSWEEKKNFCKRFLGYILDSLEPTNFQTILV